MMLFTSETSLTARIAARGQEQAALKLPDNLRCVKITRHDYISKFLVKIDVSQVLEEVNNYPFVLLCLRVLLGLSQ